LLVLCVWLCVWVLGALGIVVPPFVMKIVWIIVVLIAILLVVRALRPFAGGWLP
jgi:hypothetical protein